MGAGRSKQIMARLDRILAIVDPTSEVQPAVDKARLLVQRSGGTLELFICDFDPSLSGRPLFDTEKLKELRVEFVNERMELLEALADEIRAEGISVETHVHWDNPVHRGILRRVEESSPDLVVKDTHHHSAIRRALLTNTDWSLIRDCPTPLLLTKHREWSPHPRILAALDPEHVGDQPPILDHAILDAADLLAKTLQGELHVVHAFLSAALLAAVTGAGAGAMALPTGMSAGAVVMRERERIGAVVAKVVAAHALPAGHIHLEQGSAVDVLEIVARSLPAEVLVMGAVSRSRLQELFIGSTAERVLDRLPCDVLIVKQAENKGKTG
jgi:universal stress protein E